MSRYSNALVAAGKYKAKHLVVAEKALGKELPAGAEVHHVNENTRDNRNQNLVICENHQYHSLLHMRMRVVAASGDPNLHKICTGCKQAKLKTEFSRQSAAADGLQFRCRQCFHSIYLRKKVTN